jgi:hypothetical protein
MDAVRLQHLSLLLTAGGGSRDEEAEQMVSQVSAVRCMLYAVRDPRMTYVACRSHCFTVLSWCRYCN